MKSRIFKLVILPSLIVFVIAYIFISNQTSTTSVLVAKTDISAGVTVTNENVDQLFTTTTLPNSKLPPDVLKSKQEVIGKKVSTPRLPGDLILKSVFSNSKVKLKNDEVLIPVMIPDALKDYISQGTMLTIDTLQNASGIPAQVVKDLEVTAIVNSRDSSGSHIYAILKTTEDKSTALSPFLKSNDYIVKVQK